MDQMTSPMPPGGRTDSVVGDMYQQQRIENIISQINPDKLLNDIENRIKRKRFDAFKNEWVDIIVGQKQVSPILISNLISYLSAFLNNNVTLSNYTEDEVNRIMKLVIIHLITDMISNQKDYGLENDYSERDRIIGIVCSTISAALKRALKGNESSKFWRSLNISGEVNSLAPQESKKGLVDYLKFW